MSCCQVDALSLCARLSKEAALMATAHALRRRDDAQRFTAAECARGAAGGMLLERLLPELAYKMGRAAKYGA